MRQLTENQIQAIKRAVGHRGRKISVERFRPMSLNSYWSGGSRDYFFWVTPEGRVVETIPQNGTPFDKLNLRAEELKPGAVLVQTSVWGGKTGTMRIYVGEE